MKEREREREMGGVETSSRCFQGFNHHFSVIIRVTLMQHLRQKLVPFTHENYNWYIARYLFSLDINFDRIQRYFGWSMIIWGKWWKASNDCPNFFFKLFSLSLQYRKRNNTSRKKKCIHGMTDDFKAVEVKANRVLATSNQVK